MILNNTICCWFYKIHLSYIEHEDFSQETAEKPTNNAEVGNSELRKSEIQNSGSRENRNQETEKSDTNDTNNKETEFIDTYPSYPICAETVSDMMDKKH